MNAAELCRIYLENSIYSRILMKIGWRRDSEVINLSFMIFSVIRIENTPYADPLSLKSPVVPKFLYGIMRDQEGYLGAWIRSFKI